MNKGLIATFILILIVSFNAFPKSIIAKVVGISDGDTIRLLIDGRKAKIHLYGVDCPEKRQAFDKRVKQFTSNFVCGKNVNIDPIDRDHYGRLSPSCMLAIPVLMKSSSEMVLPRSIPDTTRNHFAINGNTTRLMRETISAASGIIRIQSRPENSGIHNINNHNSI